MNNSRPHRSGLSPRSWKQIATVVVLLLIVGYSFGRPTLERWLGMPLPSITGNDNNQNEPADDNRASSTDDVATKSSDRPSANQAGKPNTGNSSLSSPDKRTANANRSVAQKSIYDDFFKKTGRNNYISPAGLKYNMGPGGEHRIDHVLRHAKDMPSRPVHSVFSGDDFEIFESIDEAYRLIKEESRYVKSEKKQGNRTEYLVSLGRQVGYEGGQKGKRNNHPKLRNIKLILQSGSNVVTAYPHR